MPMQLGWRLGTWTPMDGGPTFRRGAYTRCRSALVVRVGEVGEALAHAAHLTAVDPRTALVLAGAGRGGQPCACLADAADPLKAVGAA